MTAMLTSMQSFDVKRPRDYGSCCHLLQQDLLWEILRGREMESGVLAEMV